MTTAPKKVVNGWAMYDWANSAYNLVITSTIFPAYFEAVTGDGIEATTQDTITLFGREFVNTSLYNYALAFAFLLVAIISPLLSSIADYKGNKKNFMNFFLTMGSIACASLFFFGRSTLTMGLISLVVACVGFWGSLVYYNSFLPEIAAPQDRDRISAKGFAYGYVGSVLLQIICFVFVFKPELIGGNKETSIQYQLCFLLVGIWWWGFGQFSLSRLPKSEPAGTGDLTHHIIAKGYKELQKVWREVWQLPVLRRYLLSFFFYNMGVQTVMLAATLYGKSELEIPTTNLIIAILIIQLIAIPGAFAISKLSEKIGNFQALMIVIAFWIGICLSGYMIPKKGIMEFYLLATVVGFVMGGIQSLSRSTYSKLMPETKDTASFFSFYDVTEKVAIVIGMFSFGYINEFTGSQRSSVLALMIFFVIGLLLLLYTISTKNGSKAAVQSQ
ncbi:MFS transporter [Terrimonas pollutisoli]|uniref:MFS transporter n=1 Tax=Terrimonas pollutisoli TaxID=3034147 RepID=UPI0023EAE010|nr:MFS transporter [Terrimonas sp. H1YJ31]